MTKNKKPNPSRENASNMDTKEVKQIKEIKLKYLSEKETNMVLIIFPITGYIIFTRAN